MLATDDLDEVEAPEKSGYRIADSGKAEGRVGEGEIGRHGDAGTRGRAESEKRIAETKRSEVPPRRVNCSRRSEVRSQNHAFWILDGEYAGTRGCWWLLA